MKEVKKSKQVKEVDEVEKVDEAEKVDEVEKNSGDKTEETTEKKNGKIFLVVLMIILVLGGGGFVAKMLLTKTSVATETVEMADGARGFSNYFKEFLLDRSKAEGLFNHGFKNMSNEEILNELTELKDGFAKVSRGVNSTYNGSIYKEMATVMENDSSLYLAAVRELRTVMTNAYENENDRRLAFAKTVEETTKELRSALYVMSSAFEGDVSGLSSKGVALFEGTTLIEVGGGVMNILIGDLSVPVVAVTTDDMETTVKPIEANGLFGYVGSRVIKIGEGLNTMLESGWVKNVKVEVKATEAILTTTKISLVMKNVSGLDEELRGQGISGLLNTDKGDTEEELNEVVKRIEGRK